MHYEGIAKTICHVCGNTKAIRDYEIEAESDKQAEQRFREKYRLCETCLANGVRAAVEFDSHIYINAVSG